MSDPEDTPAFPRAIGGADATTGSNRLLVEAFTEPEPRAAVA